MTTTVTRPVPSREAGPVADVPDPEVVERARRRTYTAKYKRDVLVEYEAADRAGKGALLRREGLYSSLISAWRDQQGEGGDTDLC
jgi:transposase